MSGLDRHLLDRLHGKKAVDELISGAWGLIANAWGGDWSKATPEWREAAERWRDKWLIGGMETKP